MADKQICVHVGEGQIDEDFYFDLRRKVGKDVKDLEVKRDGDIVLLCGDLESINHFKNLIDKAREHEIVKEQQASFMIGEFASLLSKIERAMFINRG